MQEEKIEVCGVEVPVYQLDAVVIGSGCAGLNCADWLFDFGVCNIAIVTEGLSMGTSVNTGSDKQTYYKLSMAGAQPDSVRDMAQTLFEGGSVHGDTALVEAALSARCFLKLANLGVRFPTNEFGEYVGYRTDHEVCARASSAGPETSQDMAACLLRSVQRKHIKIFDQMLAFSLLVDEDRIVGVAAVDLKRQREGHAGLVLFQSPCVVLATGGPAALYADSVYPESQHGMTGMALRAGACGANLQEWQYGLASTKFRWNVSGSYQQVLPRYISVDQNGAVHEFLPDYFESPKEALVAVFKKGYEWPFDSAKVTGSSYIDLCVYLETYGKGNRVYLDFTQDPMGLEEGIASLPAEMAHYLLRSGATARMPYARLLQMNEKAARLYQKHGIDLRRKPLEIAVCAQHHNGGLSVDCHWQTSVPGLYAVGEVAGTFGVYRPGGAALNSTQVGALRAAQHIVNAQGCLLEKAQFLRAAKKTIEEYFSILGRNRRFRQGQETLSQQVCRDLQKKMSACAAQIRIPEEMQALLTEVRKLREKLAAEAALAGGNPIDALRLRDLLICQEAVLCSMLYAARLCKSRGGAVVSKQADVADAIQGNAWERCENPSCYDGKVLVTQYRPEGSVCAFEEVRPIPVGELWFETAWKEFEENSKQAF